MLCLILTQFGYGFNEAVDLNGDWVINFQDFSLISNRWLDSCDVPDWCEYTDFDQSGVIDYQDLMELSSFWQTHSRVIINEIMYHPVTDDHNHEYIELYNRGSQAVDLSGWILSDAVDMVFPTNTTLQPDAYLVVCRNEAVVQSYYGISNTVGNYFDDKLNNAGETIVLKNSQQVIMDVVAYSDGSHPVGTDPWPTEADGSGASLELFFPESDNSIPQNWGIGQNYTPGAPNNAGISNAGDIVINEIMYKPLRQELREKFDAANFGFYYEIDEDDNGEYIELYNRGSQSIDLTGWSFTDGIEFTFGSTTLEPNEYLVVAADPNLIMTRFGIGDALGPFFNGRLNNNGERLTLRDGSDHIVDTVRYDDKHPWPLSCDEYGYSLECIAPFEDNNQPDNWRASQSTGSFVGKATPGQLNSVSAISAPPLIQDLTHTPITPTSSQNVTVTARITSKIPLSIVVLEYRLNLDTSGPFLTMYDDGAHGDGIAGDNIYGITVPAQVSQTLVHYRVYAQDDQGNLTYFPYEDDPSPTQAYYHYDNEIVTNDNLFHLFITQDNIDTLAAGVPTNSTDYVDCSLVIDHIAYPNIQTRWRGRWSRGFWPYHWKFRFNKNKLYDDNRTLDTQYTIPSKQKYIYDAFAMAGIASLESELIRLHLNNGTTNGFWANYIGFESPNSSWLDKHGHSEDTEVYKARSVESSNPRRNSDLYIFGDEDPNNGLDTDYNYWGAYNKKIDPLEPPDHIRDLVYNLNTLPDEQLLGWLGANIDVEQCFKSWGMHVYLRIDDFAGHNYYLMLPDGTDGKWKILNYDFDSFARFDLLRPFYGDGLGAGDNPDWQRNKLYERASLNPTLRRVYLLYLRELVETYDFPNIFIDMPVDMKNKITAERNYLLTELALENLPSQLDKPQISPAGGTFTNIVSISLSSPFGWDIWYTTDGSDPRLSPTRQLYSIPFITTQSITVKAAGIETGQPLNSGKWTDLAQAIFVIL